MSVRHCRFERHIPAYLEGALSDRKRRWFENRLRRFEACRAEVAAYRRMREEVSKVAVDYPDPYVWEGFTSTLRQRIEQDGRLGSPGRVRWPARGFEVAAGAVGGAVCGTVCAFAVVYFGLSSGFVPTRGSALPAPSLAVLTTPDGIELTAEVPDGRGEVYPFEFVTQDGATRVAVQMDAQQLAVLLRASAASVRLAESNEWADPPQTYDTRQGPIDLYGDSDGDVYLVSSR
jgi:hypothetical protein